MIEVKIMENFPDIHFALGSRENEVNYLRQVADHLVDNLVDENRVAGWSNDNDSPLSHLCFVAVCIITIFLSCLNSLLVSIIV